MRIVITGNPGVGKHTISDILARKLQSKIIDINKIALEKNLVVKKEETHDVDVVKLGKVLKKEIISPCVIVGHLAPYVISRKDIDRVIILRRNPYDLISVYQKRQYSKAKIQENAASEILGIVSFDSKEKFGADICTDIDTTTNQGYRKVEDVLNDNTQGDIIDWLEIIKQRGDLRKFFFY